MNWTIVGTAAFFAFVAVVLVAMVIEAITVARPPRITMERTEYADAAAEAQREEQLRQERADLYLHAVAERELMRRDWIRIPGYVVTPDPEHTEVIQQQALEETGPMMMPTTYASNGRYIDPTRRET